MTIKEIKELVENKYGCTALFIIKVGSNSFGGDTDTSDEDYAVVVDKLIWDGFKEGNVDVWIQPYEATLQTYPFIHICSLHGFESCAYCFSDEVKTFMQDNDLALEKQSSPMVYRLIGYRINELKDREDEYEQDFRSLSSVMRDVFLSLYMLENLKNDRPLCNITREQARFLRDVRGKEGERVSFEDAMQEAEALYDGLRSYYANGNFGSDRLDALRDLIVKNLQILEKTEA